MLWFFGLRMIIQRLYKLCSNPSGWFPKVRGTANTSRDPGLMKWRPTSVVCCRTARTMDEWPWVDLGIDDHNSQYPAVQKIEWRWIWEVTTQNLWWVGSPMHLMICVCIPWSTSYCNGDFPYPTKKKHYILAFSMGTFRAYFMECVSTLYCNCDLHGCYASCRARENGCVGNPSETSGGYLIY